MATRTVYLIDDDASVRRSLSRLLQTEGFRVEAFATAEEFLKIKSWKRPACVVSDIRLPGMSGLELQDICAQRSLSIPMIFITGYGEIPMSVQAMKKGAVDFLPKPYNNQALFQAIEIALDNDRESAQQESIFYRVRKRFEALSEREKEVLQGIITGLLNKQIGFKLTISEKTVKFHRANIMLKMKAASVPHLVRLAEAAGIALAVK